MRHKGGAEPLPYNVLNEEYEIIRWKTKFAMTGSLKPPRSEEGCRDDVPAQGFRGGSP